MNFIQNHAITYRDKPALRPCSLRRCPPRLSPENLPFLVDHHFSRWQYSICRSHWAQSLLVQFHHPQLHDRIEGARLRKAEHLHFRIRVRAVSIVTVTRIGDLVDLRIVERRKAQSTSIRAPVDRTIASKYSLSVQPVGDAVVDAVRQWTTFRDLLNELADRMLIVDVVLVDEELWGKEIAISMQMFGVS